MKLSYRKFIPIFMGILITIPCSTSFGLKCRYCGEEIVKNPKTIVELHICDGCWFSGIVNKSYFCRECRDFLPLVEYSRHRIKCLDCNPVYCEHERCPNAISRDDYEMGQTFCFEHGLYYCINCGCEVMDEEGKQSDFCQGCRRQLSPQ